MRRGEGNRRRPPGMSDPVGIPSTRPLVTGLDRTASTRLISRIGCKKLRWPSSRSRNNRFSRNTAPHRVGVGPMSFFFSYGWRSKPEAGRGRTHGPSRHTSVLVSDLRAHREHCFSDSVYRRRSTLGNKYMAQYHVCDSLFASCHTLDPHRITHRSHILLGVLLAISFASPSRTSLDPFSGGWSDHAPPKARLRQSRM
jgi:hypothetical protein